jgi:phosphopantetheine--protein transferase-like protein
LPPVGNDIVDLQDPENRGKSRDRRFAGRVFTPRERQRIEAAARPDALLWSLWAAKEAAYKAFSRGNPGIPSIPKQYHVSFDDEAIFAAPQSAAGLPFTVGGRVVAPPGELALRVWVTGEHVHALAADMPERVAQMLWRVVSIDAAAAPAEDPSALVRRVLLARVADLLGCPAEVLTVRKEDAGSGAPSVFLGESLVTTEISLSHDGRFVAFALDAAALMDEAGRCRPAPSEHP